MNFHSDSDSTLYVRFFASCSLVLGLASSAWTVYFCIWYPVDLQRALQRLAIMMALAIGGATLLLLYPRRHRHTHSITMRIDGLMLFLSIPALMLFVFVSVFYSFSFESMTIDRVRFASVLARVDSMELRHIDAESVKADASWQEIFFLPEKYIDLWVACGQVTIQEMDGKAIEPLVGQGMFTLPKVKFAGRRRPRYIEHYKTHAVMDSEHYAVGKTYPGWVLRDTQSVVYFMLPEIRRFREFLTLVSLTLIVSLYLVIRIAIGIKLQDQNWRAFKSIVIDNDSSDSRK